VVVDSNFGRSIYPLYLSAILRRAATAVRRGLEEYRNVDLLEAVLPVLMIVATTMERTPSNVVAPASVCEQA